MTQLKDYRSRYAEIADSTRIFLLWLTLEDGYTIRDSDLWDHLENPNDKPECVLDYLLGWLGEGNATKHCPTYEDWLLTVIGISDQLRGGVLQHQRAEEIADYTITEILAATDGRVDLSVPLLDDNLGMDHPALSRAVYERCRAGALAEINRSH